MPVSGVTIHIVCPDCGAAVDVLVEGAEPGHVPPLGDPLLAKTVPYRCHDCEHLGEVHVEVQPR